jgi:O-antigen/teichoic acid export membrane protein
MSVGRATGFNLAAAAAPVFFTLAVTPFYLHAIGPERFGTLAICWTIIGALAFASFGMGPALSYRLALMEEAAASKRSGQVWMALLIGAAASLGGALLVLFIGRAYFRHFASVSTIIEVEIRSALPLLALLLPLSVVASVFNGALQGRKRFDAFSSVSVVNAFLIATLPLAAAVFVGPAIPTLILAMVLAGALVVSIQLFICVRVVPLRFPSKLRLTEAKPLLRHGAWMSVTALVAPLVLLFDRFVIGGLRGAAEVAVYVLAFQLLQGLLLIPASLSTAMLPSLAPLSSKKAVEEVQGHWLTWLNAVLTPAIILAIALSAPFFRVWVGPTLGSAAAPVAVILLVGCWAHGIAHIPSTVVVARGRPDLLTKLLLFCMLPYIPLLYFATERFGLRGAAAVWSIRAAFDLTLFLYARPRAADMRPLVTSAALVLSAMAVALWFAWNSSIHWGLMAAILTLAAYRSRNAISSSLLHLRAAWSRLAKILVRAPQ